MSPAFVNIGAHVGDGTLVDSCDTVGSCAQIGGNVKLGANTLIGGVLEPVEDAPRHRRGRRLARRRLPGHLGFVVGENSVVGENTLLTPRIPIYDLVEEEVIYGELPPERAFTRFVESSVSDHEMFDGGAYKPAVVATDVEEQTLRPPSARTRSGSSLTQLTVVLCGVGADTGNVRPVPRVDGDGRFDYVPIPEKGPTTEEATYGSLESRHGDGSLAETLDGIRPGSEGDWVTDATPSNHNRSTATPIWRP